MYYVGSGLIAWLVEDFHRLFTVVMQCPALQTYMYSVRVLPAFGDLPSDQPSSDISLASRRCDRLFRWMKYVWYMEKSV